jgi:hypothetical protein
MQLAPLFDKLFTDSFQLVLMPSHTANAAWRICRAFFAELWLLIGTSLYNFVGRSFNKASNHINCAIQDFLPMSSYRS